MNTALLNGEGIAISTTPSSSTPIRMWVLVWMYRIGQYKDTTDNTIWIWIWNTKTKNGTTNTTINYIKLNYIKLNWIHNSETIYYIPFLLLCSRCNTDATRSLSLHFWIYLPPRTSDPVLQYFVILWLIRTYDKLYIQRSNAFDSWTITRFNLIHKKYETQW